METNLHRPRVRRAQNHLADWRRLVVDVPEPRLEPFVVESSRAEQAHFLFRSEEELDAAMRAVLGEHAASAFEHRGDSRLVVGAEDRPG